MVGFSGELNIQGSGIGTEEILTVMRLATFGGLIHILVMVLGNLFLL